MHAISRPVSIRRFVVRPTPGRQFIGTRAVRSIDGVDRIHEPRTSRPFVATAISARNIVVGAAAWAPKAITAMAHRLARLVHRRLLWGHEYVDKGPTTRGCRAQPAMTV